MQGGRVLIVLDNTMSAKDTGAQPRVNLYDTVSGSIAHQIVLPAGMPRSIDVSPDGRYLAAMLDDGDSGMKLSVWRLDGKKPAVEEGPQAPASVRPE
jgi:hypothetical protein